MAKRTINRRVTSLPGKSLNEQYFNFASFNGLCDNKNYLGIDQQTLEEADNVYMDQDNQLSSRPAIKRVEVLPPNERIIKIYKINNLVIYHIHKDNYYIIRFKYKDEWYIRQVNIDINIMWFDDRYVVFSDTDLISFKFDFESDTIKWFTAEETIYIPIGGEGAVTQQDPNLFTTKRRLKLALEKVIPITPQFVEAISGKEVTIEIGDESFVITWVENNERVLTQQLSYTRLPLIIASENIKPVYMGLELNDYSSIYLSTDGKVFQKVNTIGNGIHQPVLADDGSQVYYISYSGSELTMRYQTVTELLKGTAWITTTMNCTTLFPNLTPQPGANNRGNYDVNTTYYPSDYVNYFGTTYICTAQTYPGLADHGPGGAFSGPFWKKSNSSTEPTNSYNASWGSGGGIYLTDINLRATNFGTSEGTPFKPFGNAPNNGLIIWLVPAYTPNVYTYKFPTSYSGSYVNYTSYQYTLNLAMLVIWNGGTFSAYPLPFPNDNAYRVHEALNYMPLTDGNYNQAKIKFVNREQPLIRLSWRQKNSTTFFIGDIKCSSGSIVPMNSFDINRTCGEVIGQTYYNIRAPFINYFIRETYSSSNRYTAFTDMRDYYSSDFNYRDEVSNLIYIEAHNINLNVYFYKETITSIPSHISWNDDPALNLTFAPIFRYTNLDGINNETRQNKPASIVSSGSGASYSGLGPLAYKVGADGNVLTNKFYRYEGVNIPLLDRTRDEEPDINCPLMCVQGEIVYQNLTNGYIYTSQYTGRIFVSLLSEGKYTFFVPNHTINGVNNFISKNNVLYISKRVEGDTLYFPETHNYTFADEITSLVNFSPLVVGVFLEYEVYEIAFNSSLQDYVRSKTKLQLGCRKGSEVLLNYDGETILLTTIKGLNALNYQDFVQSTEHVYKYLTENIMSTYDLYDKAPIKLTQWKNWIFMYRADVNYLYVYDLRNQSWWKWTNSAPVTQIVFDGNIVLLLIDGLLYKYDFDYTGNYSDDTGLRIDWSLRSQKLHFDAVNNYKHIRSLSIVTSQDQEQLVRFKLGFVNYRDLSYLSEIDINEQEVSLLTTVICKVNFTKTNAFQFSVANDKNNPTPVRFVTPDIAIKYRITERLR